MLGSRHRTTQLCGVLLGSLRTVTGKRESSATSSTTTGTTTYGRRPYLMGSAISSNDQSGPGWFEDTPNGL